MKKYFAIIAIVALAAFGPSAFAQDKATTPPPSKSEKPAAQGLLARVENALQITPEQEAKLKDFHKARQEENKAFAEQMKKFNSDMQALRKDDKADPDKVNGLIDQMFKLRADRAKAQFKNRKEIEKIFTPEQLQKIKKGRSMFMGRGRMGGFMGGFMLGRMGGPGAMGFGRGMMMRRPMMRFGMRLGMMERFMHRGGMFRFGPVHRPGNLRAPAPLKDKATDKSPEIKK